MARWKALVKAASTIPTIDVPRDYGTIQEAIDHAKSGDIIFVHNGTYNEDVVVGKSVSLVGESRETTIIDGRDSPVSIVADNVSITDFTIKKNVTNPSPIVGILVNSSGNVIYHNKITNGVYGISFSASSRNVISDNIISNNYEAINKQFSSENVVSNNIVVNNTRGISFFLSNNNVFWGNILANNTEGLTLTLANNNIFYHNNFYDTVTMASGLPNAWNNTGEGNYWINYTGKDLNNDGIGDEPYSPKAGITDNYPLMGMFSGFTAFLRGETYQVDITSNSTVSDFKFEIGEETGNKIIRFTASDGDGTVGFCRIMFPTALMPSPLLVFDGEREVTPTLLSISSTTNAYLYFTYIHGGQIITVISSTAMRLHNELLDMYLRLQMDFYGLNATYYDLLRNYTSLLDNYTKLRQNHDELNSSYLQYLVDFYRNVQNVQNLMYIFAATTTILLITTVYLSKRASTRKHSED